MSAYESHCITMVINGNNNDCRVTFCFAIVTGSDSLDAAAIARLQSTCCEVWRRCLLRSEQAGFLVCCRGHWHDLQVCLTVVRNLSA